MYGLRTCWTGCCSDKSMRRRLDPSKHMKFACDSCHTKYTIADERVHGRVLKIRCKTCDHVITVREEVLVLAPEDLEPPPSDRTMISALPVASSDGEEWFVSFDGDQEGPMS